MEAINYITYVFVIFLVIISLIILQHVKEMHNQLTNVTISSKLPLKDYQLEVIEDTILVWDSNRFVGKIFYTDDEPLGYMIQEDNQ